MGTLYFGDNLDILRSEIDSNSVDLVYLDPPFNSKRDYNLLFKTPKGFASDAQITAFDDTWRWGPQAETEFDELLHQPNTDVAEMIQSLRRFLKESDMMAYLTMMANRLLELHRVLKPTGSLYLHCDPTASHYLKIVLDTIFGAVNFKSEIVWKRTTAHSSAKRWGPVHDILLHYSKSGHYTWNDVYQNYSDEYLKSKYRYSDNRGVYRIDNLTGAGTRNGSSGDTWRGYDVRSKGAHWNVNRNAVESILGSQAPAKMTTQEKLDLLDANGFIYWPKGGQGFPSFKRYLGKGLLAQDVIIDIPPINSQAAERMGYPTQKPLALLECILQASSNPGDVVLDPFCGCGTAVHAAQKLGRNWIGIDITHLAISLIEKRMKDAFPSISFDVYGTPKDLAGASDLALRDKYQFQWWACSLVNAQPYQGKKKGADGGIDGLIFFQDDSSGAKKIVVSVKGGDHVSVTMVRDLIATVEREKAAIGLFVTLAEPTRPMLTEAVSAGFYKSPKGDVPKIQILTVGDLLTGQVQAQFFDMSSGVYNFKKAKVERRSGEQKKLF